MRVLGKVFALRRGPASNVCSHSVQFGRLLDYRYNVTTRNSATTADKLGLMSSKSFSSGRTNSRSSFFFVERYRTSFSYSLVLPSKLTIT